MGKYIKLIKDFFLMVLGQFSSKLLSFLLVPLYTNILTTEEYGTYELILTTVTLLTPIFTLVISESVMRFCLDKENDSRNVLTIGLFVVFVGSVLTFTVFPITLVVEALKGHFWWILAFFATSNLHTVLSQYLKGVGQIRFYTVCGVISTAVTLGLNVLFLVMFQWGIVGYMAAYVLSHFVISIIILIKIKVWSQLRNPFKISKDLYVAVIKYSCPLIPNSLSWWINNSLDKYMITWMVSTAAMGIYSVAYKIPSIISIFVTIFMTAFQISVVENFGSEESKRFFGQVYKALSSFCIIGVSGLVVLAKPIASILYQKDFFSAWSISCVLIFSVLFHALSGCLGTIYTSAKKTKFLFYSTGIGAIVNIILNVILIYWLGIIGAAIATLISNAVVWFSRLINSRKLIAFPINILTDSLSFVLIVVQIFLVIQDQLYCYIGAIGLLIIILAINVWTFLSSGILSRLKNKSIEAREE